MTVNEAARMLEATIVTGAALGERVVTGGYASDLLSDVMAHAQEGDLWVTLQRHVNVVAVAHLKGLAAVVLVNGRQPEADAVRRAVDEQVVMLSTPLPAFDAVGRLYAAGIRGGRTS